MVSRMEYEELKEIKIARIMSAEKVAVFSKAS